MVEDSRGLLIFGLGVDRDVEETKRRVSEIDGVLGVDYNHVTRKLLVRYRGDSAGLRNVESRIKKVLEAKPAAERKGSRRIRGRERR
jgi:hypothetical protein